MKKKQTFDYKLYRRMAQGIHDKFCNDLGWCNYGREGFPPDMEDSIKLPAEERQDRAGRRLAVTRHCQVAVDAENIAAHIQFGKGAKVRKFPPDWMDE